jgi:hypothetical protein
MRVFFMKKFQAYIICFFIFSISLPIYAAADDESVKLETLEAALTIVDTLEGPSCDYSWIAFFENTTDDDRFHSWVKSVRTHKDQRVRQMAPIMIELVQLLYARGERLRNIVIRIDPNTQSLTRSQRGFPNNRNASSVWHRHAPSESYLYTLSRQIETSTQLREAGQISFVPLQTLFLLRGNMEHRSPPHTVERYRRVHFSFGTVDQENIEVQQAEPPLKKRKMDNLLNPKAGQFFETVSR